LGYYPSRKLLNALISISIHVLSSPVLYLFAYILPLDQLCYQVIVRILIHFYLAPAVFVTRRTRTFFQRSFVWRCEYNEFVRSVWFVHILSCALTLITAEAMIFQDKCSVSSELNRKHLKYLVRYLLNLHQ
jgi:hypothetical protein